MAIALGDGQMQPLKADLVDEVYATYILIIENLLEERGGTWPRTEALCFLSLVEGSIIFIGSDRRWGNDSPAV